MKCQEKLELTFLLSNAFKYIDRADCQDSGITLMPLGDIFYQIRKKKGGVDKETNRRGITFKALF